MLACFNIRVASFGKIPNQLTRNTMFIANHISWVDIHAFNSVTALRFIAKSEISQWPVFGYFAKKSGTIFINRGRRKDAAHIVKETARCLADGDNVGFFPEGTTTDGTTLAPFKSSLLQAAISANAHLVPVAIRYPTSTNRPNTQMAYAGETTLAESMMAILKQKSPTVELHFLPAINIAGLGRQSISQAAQQAIAAELDF